MAMDPSDKRGLHLPLIPPLPSSSSSEKENQFRAGGKNELEAVVGKFALPRPKIFALRNTPSNSGRRALGDPIANASSKTNSKAEISAIVPQRPLLGSQRRVLRYAETLEALFCLNDLTKTDHRQLCQNIANGLLADDPPSWLRALHVATCTVAASPQSSKIYLVNDLMRLHRRATSRFTNSLDKGSGQQLQGSDILAIWLSYADAQAVYGTVDGARSTYKYIQNQNLGLTNASFYLSLALLEEKHDISRAIEVIKEGIGQNAEPLLDLQQKLNELESRVRKHPVEERKSNLVPSLTSSTSSIRTKRKGVQDLSPKRLKKSDSTYTDMPATKKEENDDASNMSVGTDGLSLSTLGDTKDDTRPTLMPMEKEAPSDQVEKMIEQSVEFNSKSADTDPESGRTPKVVRDVNPNLSSAKSKRSSLLTTTPRLFARAGLGKAQRVNPSESQNPDTDEDSSNETNNAMPVKNFKARPLEKEEKTKLSRMDLSYMLQWDPSRRPGEHTGNHTSDKISSANQDKKGDRSLSKIDEVSSRTSAVTLSSSISGSVHTSCRLTTHSNDSIDSTRSSDKERDVSTAARAMVVPANHLEQQSLSPETASLVAQSNVDFLPLVNENNILRVNGTPYVKLGVLGKGGSCKVYRALSKDCSVLAIKRVKIGGMDRKAIDGYANEIALLKRLRGNPAIIQMYDSEVDQARKAIFLVMEVGEVDLNYVLQQQAVHAVTKSPGQRPPLNMNFIRLTWQQMLNAVHCIHEERIIHGDLKPANFLFVRGALKLIDFGIAKAMQSDDTTNIYRDSQIGTLNYMSPEAILDTGSGADGARMKCGKPSDIWSLGCILYQMVYGQTPFAQLHMIPKLQAIVNHNHKISFPDHADEAAIDAMRQCLRRKADERPPIVGRDGLLNEHYFLNSRRKSSSKHSGE
jgi:serine/threonine-protein kinase RIO1